MLGLDLMSLATRKQGVRYSAQADALFARMTTAPTPARKTAIDRFISSVVAAGAWSKLDALWVAAAHDEGAARLNWVDTSYTLIPINSPNFQADRGYAGDGALSYLRTGFNPALAARYQRNSAHIAMWSLTNSAADVIDIGARQSSSANQSVLFGRNLSGQFGYRVNIVGGTPTAPVSTSAAYAVGVRADANTLIAYQAGAQIGNTTAYPSTSPPSLEFFLGAGNQAGSPASHSQRRIAMAHVGGALSADEISAVAVAAQAYLASVGAI